MSATEIPIPPRGVLVFIASVFWLAFSAVLLVDSVKLDSNKMDWSTATMLVACAVLVCSGAALWIYARLSQGNMFYYGGNPKYPAVWGSMVWDFASDPMEYAGTVVLLGILPTTIAVYRFFVLLREEPRGTSHGGVLVRAILGLINFAASVVTLIFSSYHF